MKKRLALVAVLAMALVPPARALVPKCGDAPYRDGKGRLWITWVDPVPASARVRALAPGEFPKVKGVEAFYEALRDRGAKQGRKWAPLEACKESPDGAALRTSSPRQLRQWEWKRYEIDAVAEATLPLLEYQAEAVDFWATGVQHPPVASEAERLSLAYATPIVTHAVVDVGGKALTAWVRSVILSRNQDGSVQYCFRSRGYRATVPARPDGAIPVYQRFAQLLQDDGVVVVDVRSKKDFTVAVPASAKIDAKVEVLGKIADGKGGPYFASRVSWTLPKGTAAADFLLQVTSR